MEQIVISAVTKMLCRVQFSAMPDTLCPVPVLAEAGGP